MTEPHPAIPDGILPEATDLRRAAAILLHADPVTFNLTGVAEVIAEVKLTDRRIIELITGMAVLAYQTPDLGTEEGQRALRNSWAHYKTIEQQRKGHDD
ncbi:hypothetical protein [Mycolicibacterium sp. XJ870]